MLTWKLQCMATYGSFSPDRRSAMEEGLSYLVWGQHSRLLRIW